MLITKALIGPLWLLNSVMFQWSRLDELFVVHAIHLLFVARREGIELVKTRSELRWSHLFYHAKLAIEVR